MNMWSNSTAGWVWTIGTGLSRVEAFSTHMCISTKPLSEETAFEISSYFFRRDAGRSNRERVSLDLSGVALSLPTKEYAANKVPRPGLATDAVFVTATSDGSEESRLVCWDMANE